MKAKILTFTLIAILFAGCNNIAYQAGNAIAGLLTFILFIFKIGIILLVIVVIISIIASLFK